MSEALRVRNAQRFLDWKLHQVRLAEPLLPALGGALVVGDQLVYQGAQGTRRHGHDAPVQTQDRFHIGSVSKPLTGYLMAVMRKQGFIHWQRTLGETWPGMFLRITRRGSVPTSAPEEWSAHYRDTPLHALMTHSAGFDTDPRTATNEAYAAIHATPDARLPDKRRLRTRMALQDRPYQGWSSVDPQGPPPVKYSSSCIIAASMAETLSGKSWEQLIEAMVFVPLGMTRWSFARVSAPNAVTDLWWHRRNEDDQVEASHFPEDLTSQVQHTNRPAGAVSLSLQSWGQWAKALVADRDTPHMTRTVLDEYFLVPTGLRCAQGGFFAEGEERFQHNGHNGWNYALMRVDRRARCASFGATNMDGPEVAGSVAGWVDEIDGVGQAWHALEHLHECFGPGEVEARTGSGADASALVDASFASRWNAPGKAGTLVLRLTSAHWLKGLALCQFATPRLTDLELEFVTPDGQRRSLAGAALQAITRREGGVIAMLFAAPERASELHVHFKNASAPPRLHRLMLMHHERSALRSLAVTRSGGLWIVDAAGRVLGSSKGLSSEPCVMDHSTLGRGRQLARGSGKLWVIGTDRKLWRGEPDGFHAVAGSPLLRRLAVDALNDQVWMVDEAGTLRSLLNGGWRQPAGAGTVLDVCAHAGQAWFVGADGRVHGGAPGAWQQRPAAAKPLARIAVDTATLRLWALDGEGGVHALDRDGAAWRPHPGNGWGAAIAVHSGTPYVIGRDEGLWRSAGDAGWTPLTVLQPRGAL
jgi:CubicO group peptidase (beta-lactamase class C family)